MSKKSLEFWIQYNWPTSKASLSLFRLSPHNADFKIRVLAEKNTEKGKRYTFKELSEGTFNVSDVTKLLQSKASAGQYLTGDIFYIEIFDGADKYVKGTSFLVAEKWPARAKGATHVESQYFLDL